LRGKGLRQDLYGTGVGVSLVDPGFIREAGMFANSGATLPRGFRTCAPQQVARAVIRAIERNRAETIVAPVETRLAVAFGGLAPELNARVQRRLGMSLRSEPVGVAGAGHFDGEHQNTRAAANISWRASGPPGTPI
jgi:short-subunit dehydrogenase